MLTAKKALVIGYGSIGKRHVDVLNQIGLSVDIVTHQKIPGKYIYRSSSRTKK